MGTLFGFIVGYVVGARAGSERFDQVVESFQELRRSPELQNFLAALRGHARDTAREIGDRLDAGGMPDADDLLAETRARIGLD